MGTGDKMLHGGVGNLRWTSIPSRRSSDTRLHVKETEISFGSVGQFGSSAALLYTVSHAGGKLSVFTCGFLSSISQIL